jgi:hypothetical protein
LASKEHEMFDDYTKRVEALRREMVFEGPEDAGLDPLAAQEFLVACAHLQLVLCCLERAGIYQERALGQSPYRQ